MVLKKVNTFFYAGLLISFIIFLLPVEYKMAVYSPNYLGWFMLLLAALSCVIFLVLSIVDFRKKNYESLKRRTLFFILIIGISVAYWFFQAYSQGNL